MTILDPPLVSAEDRGLLLGDGLFETIRLYGGRPFRLRAHLDRLTIGARRLGIRVPAELESRIARVVSDWRGSDAALRITLTRGPGSGLLPSQSGPGHAYLSIRALSSPAPPRPLRALIRGRIDEQALTVGLKTLGYVERIQALRLARAEGSDEALLKNSQNVLVEGAASNLFAVTRRHLVAPGPGQGALAGITRAILLELADSLGLPVQERGLAESELPNVSEVFLSSSLRELAPVVVVDDRAIGTGEPGPVFLALSEAFRSRVDREVSLTDPMNST